MAGLFFRFLHVKRFTFFLVAKSNNRDCWTIVISSAVKQSIKVGSLLRRFLLAMTVVIVVYRYLYAKQNLRPLQFIL